KSVDLAQPFERLTIVEAIVKYTDAGENVGNRDWLINALKELGMKEGEAIVHPWINKALERAQKKVEARNFDIRKNLLKYDDVLNDQRKVIFEQRIELMDGENLSEIVGGKLRHYATVTREDYPFQGRITDLIVDGKMFEDLGLPRFDPAVDRGMICGSSAMLKDTKALLEQAG
ncbi:hypothetical protein ACFODN_12925, partial [Rodentibacter caecimuris]